MRSLVEARSDAPLPGGGARIPLIDRAPAALRRSGEVDFDVRIDEGTCVAARVFAAPVPRSEVAVIGRPCSGETTSGDDAGFVRGDGGALLLFAVDGLGHGPPAREAAARAV